MKRNAKFCLDAFARLAWLQDEPGAPAVQHCLDAAERGHADCLTSIKPLEGEQDLEVLWLPQPR